MSDALANNHSLHVFALLDRDPPTFEVMIARGELVRRAHLDESGHLRPPYAAPKRETSAQSRLSLAVKDS